MSRNKVGFRKVYPTAIRALGRRAAIDRSKSPVFTRITEHIIDKDAIVVTDGLACCRGVTQDDCTHSPVVVRTPPMPAGCKNRLRIVRNQDWF
jgi:hypothetical protein